MVVVVVGGVSAVVVAAVMRAYIRDLLLALVSLLVLSANYLCWCCDIH